ncbi:hypothetical protein PS687_02912 [Pseudomonas fluorescens]|nr:hypothetical protein PS687_02912 [Pseudomonas fluorescens]
MRYVDRTQYATPHVMVDAIGKLSEAKLELKAVEDYINEKARLRADAEHKKAQAKLAGLPAPKITAKQPSPFKLYKHDSVRSQLNEMFHRKCAYCESFYYATSAMEVEHFRPKEGLYGEDYHQGYWWLGASWDNLLPSCIYCNQRRSQTLPKMSGKPVVLHEAIGQFDDQRSAVTGKGTHFPILGDRVTSPGDCSKEFPLLLNPCQDQPQDHLEYYIDSSNIIGLILAKPNLGAVPLKNGLDQKTQEEFRNELALTLKHNLDLRGSVSILIYGLNRLGLVQERTRVLRQLIFMESQVVDLTVLIEKLKQRMSKPAYEYADEDKQIEDGLRQLRDRTVQQMRSMAKPQAPYSMMVRAYLEGFAARLA